MVADESTTQILTMIRDDVKASSAELTHLGKRVAVLSQVAHDQQQDLRDVKAKVEKIADDTTTCAARLGWDGVLKRVSNVESLSRKPNSTTPVNGIQLKLGLPGAAFKRWLPWIILAAVVGVEGMAQLNGSGILSLIFGGKP